MFCRLVTGQEATCSAWNHDFVAIPAHLMVLHQHLSPCFAHPMAMGGVMPGVILYGWEVEGTLGEAGVKELMLRTPGACWRMEGNSQSAQHRKSSADLQLSCQADEHSQLVGGNAALSLLICMDITPGAHVLPRRPQEMREQRMPRCPRTNRQLSDVQWRSRGHCRGQGKVSMRTLTPE